MSQVKTGRRFTFDEFAIKSHNSSFSVQIFTYIDSKAKNNKRLIAQKSDKTFISI